MENESFLKVQRALAEPKRLEILERIRKLEADAGVMCSIVLAETDVSQSTFSHHVSELLEAGLVCGDKQGRAMLLSVNKPVIEEFLIELKQKMLGN